LHFSKFYSRIFNSLEFQKFWTYNCMVKNQKFKIAVTYFLLCQQKEGKRQYPWLWCTWSLRPLGSWVLTLELIGIQEPKVSSSVQSNFEFLLLIKIVIKFTKHFKRDCYYESGLRQWGSVTHQMAVPVPNISCCVLNHHN
jgi:hypothetical protein